MKKTLVYSDADVVQIFIDEDCELFEIEESLGIEFPFQDGTYHSDVDWDVTPDFDENQPIDMAVFRKDDDCGLPERYPCVVVSFYEDTFDRCGKLKINMFEYVYLEDFNKE